MPELPDIVIYIEQLQARVLHEQVQSIRLLNPFLLRSVTPPLHEVVGRKIVALLRSGKRIVLGLEGDLFLVIQPNDRRAVALAPDSSDQNRAQLSGRPFFFIR